MKHWRMVKINVFYDISLTSQPQKGGLVQLYIHHSLLFLCILADSVSIGTITPSPLSPGTVATGKSI